VRVDTMDARHLSYLRASLALDRVPIRLTSISNGLLVLLSRRLLRVELLLLAVVVVHFRPAAETRRLGLVRRRETRVNLAQPLRTDRQLIATGLDLLRGTCVTESHD